MSCVIPSEPLRKLQRTPVRTVLACLLAAWLSVVGTRAAAQDDAFDEPEVIDMSPDEAVGWSLRNVAAPVGAVFQGGFGYWYDEREIDVDTTPSGGFVDLFYVRRNFQKRFEQAQAPVKVLLPPRIKAGPRDALVVRAFHEGYRQQSVTIPVKSREASLVINLEPLPNRLEAVAHRYFAGRASLVFLTRESPTFRVSEKPRGFSLILNETARSAEAEAAIDGLLSPMLAGAVSEQVGEDFVLNVEFADDRETMLRSRLDHNAARGLYAFTLDLVPAAGAGEAIQRAQAALARLRSEHVSGCSMVFDNALRAQLEIGALSRAVTPKGDFTDRYLRAAMRRLGEISPKGGVVEFAAGVVYRPTVPIELEVALSQAGEAKGFLALLRQFVSELEETPHRRETFRSLIAPEMDPLSFGVVMDKAEASEQDCIAKL